MDSLKERRENGTEQDIWRNNGWNVLNLAKEMYSIKSFKKPQAELSVRKATPSYIISKLLKTKYEENILKKSWGKWHIVYRGTIQMIPSSSLVTMSLKNRGTMSLKCQK